MEYIKATLLTGGTDAGDILMALLGAVGYDGFEEKDNELLAYIVASKFDPEELKKVTEATGINYTTEHIPPQNWNAVWESNFQPVLVDDFCTIRADFHELKAATPYEIIITPKMSFGTGHHATTQLMIMLMKELSFAGKTVLDFGTGTGVLAILADMLGAKQVTAIDNDEWSVENAKENVLRNNRKNITVQQGILEETTDVKTDIILANINRNILLQYMEKMYDKLNSKGTILMSGLLTEDREVMVEAATSAGFELKEARDKNNWIVLWFNKI